MIIMQRIMDDIELDKLIEMRKCLRLAIAEAMVKAPQSEIDEHLQRCLKILEQLIIKGIRDGNPQIDDQPDDGFS